MANPPPVVVVKEKRGLGCFGAGCLIVLVAVLLCAALVGGGGYFLYSKGNALTSQTPSTVQTFDGGDDVYHAAEQKLTTFNQAVQQGQPGTLELTADEINTLIARAPDFNASQVHLFVSMTDNKGKVQMSLPTSLLPLGILKDRFINGEAEFTPGFDSSTKSVTLLLHSLRIGSEDVPKENLPMISEQIAGPLNTQLDQTPAVKQVLDRATSIEVRNGKFVVQTQ